MTLTDGKVLSSKSIDPVATFDRKKISAQFSVLWPLEQSACRRSVNQKLFKSRQVAFVGANCRTIIFKSYRIIDLIKTGNKFPSEAFAG